MNEEQKNAKPISLVELSRPDRLTNHLLTSDKVGVKIQGKSIHFYKKSKLKGSKSTVKESSKANLKENKFKGVLSPASIRKLVNTCQSWSDAILYYQKTIEKRKIRSKYYFSFLTLTLPAEQFHDDREMKSKGLAPFIKRLLRLKPDVHYMWKAETQINGNIHFHIILDHFVDHVWCKENWNEILDSLGYIDKYEERSHDRNPPSTHITGQGKIEHIVDYLAYYLSKNDGRRPIEGRIWGCSDILKNLTSYVCLTNPRDINEIINDFKSSITTYVVHDHGLSLYMNVNVEYVDIFPLQKKDFDYHCKMQLDILEHRHFTVRELLDENEDLRNICEDSTEIFGLYLFENDMLGTEFKQRNPQIPFKDLF